MRLNYYCSLFLKLKRDMKYGGAPHKPILLLSILDMYEQGVCDSARVYVTPELVASFKANWARLVDSDRHYPIFALPFYHLRSEPFWQLVPNPGCEKWLDSKITMRNFNNLTTAVAYALVDEDLAALMMQKETREIMRNLLCSKYFPNKSNDCIFYESNEILSTGFLYEDSSEYISEMERMKNTVDLNTFQENIYIRGAIFKREIPRLYNYTCAMSGMQISAMSNISMIDACHIVPFADSYDDTLNNGIALCPTLHRAFDCGLISISDDYTILINKNFIENTNSLYNLSQLKGKSLYLPTDTNMYPSLDNIQKHRIRFGF